MVDLARVLKTDRLDKMSPSGIWIHLVFIY